MRIVVALGGNALMERGGSADAQAQIENVRRAAEVLGRLGREHELVITHGNGPQVGVLALESANDPSLSTPTPFDTLGAQTQGMIGYWLVQALGNAMPGRTVTAVVTRTEVSAEDPACENPTKFVGEMYTEQEAQQNAARWGWTVRPDGTGYRRVVPSPAPVRIVEEPAIRALIDAGTVVVCAGGGGIPVVRGADGALRGVEAVIDKDLTGQLLAEMLGADVFLVLTDVPYVMKGFGTPQQEAITHSTPERLRELALPAGSMGPKAQAVASFVETTGAMAAIGRLVDAVEIIAGRAGTIVTPSGEYPVVRAPKVPPTLPPHARS